MNILEAFEAVKQGKFVRVDIEADIWYVCASVSPLERGLRLQVIDREQFGEYLPEFETINFEERDEFCLPSLTAGYEVISVQHMMEEIQEDWTKRNKEDPE